MFLTSDIRDGGEKVVYAQVRCGGWESPHDSVKNCILGGISLRARWSPWEPFVLWTIWDLSGCDYCIQSLCSLLILFLGVSSTDKI